MMLNIPEYIVWDVAKVFPGIEKDDIRQEAYALLYAKPDDVESCWAIRWVKYRLFDCFKMTKWQNSYKGKFKHIHYGLEIAEEYQPTCEPESDDAIMADWILARLFPDEQELLRMYYWEGLSQQDIASQTGMARSTVANKIGQVLNICREILEVT